jgi:hypothetical protein
LIGGYICGMIAGLFGFYLAAFFPGLHLSVAAAAAVGAAALLMICFNFGHPPAAALALGLSSSPRPLLVALIALCSIIALCLAARLLKPWLRDLL